MARRIAPDTESTTDKPTPAPKPAAKKAAAPKAPAKPKAEKPAPAPKAEKAPKAPKRATPETGEKEKQTRQHHGRGWLAAKIDGVLRAFEAGKLKNVEGPLTVHKIAQLITNPDGEHPSTGAVTAALVRWAEQGYIKVDTKPLAFKGFAAKWKDSNLDNFLEDLRAKSAKARAAARAEKAKS